MTEDNNGVDRDELARRNAEFETAPAGKAITWALESFGRSLALAASFEDIVLIDLVVRNDPDVEVIFLDTGAHFPETLEYVEQVREHYGLNLTVTHPGPEADAHPCGTAQCCAFRKVAPLRSALQGKSAWMTSLKRDDGPSRLETPIVSWDDTFGLVKVNPLATWTHADITSYLSDHGLAPHPLTLRGYRSIGCAPTTLPVGDDDNPRAGRWVGMDKTECGLHV